MIVELSLTNAVLRCGDEGDVYAGAQQPVQVQLYSHRLQLPTSTHLLDTRLYQVCLTICPVTNTFMIIFIINSCFYGPMVREEEILNFPLGTTQSLVPLLSLSPLITGEIRQDSSTCCRLKAPAPRSGTIYRII